MAQAGISQVPPPPLPVKANCSSGLTLTFVLGFALAKPVAVEQREESVSHENQIILVEVRAKLTRHRFECLGNRVTIALGCIGVVDAHPRLMGAATAKILIPPAFSSRPFVFLQFRSGDSHVR